VPHLNRERKFLIGNFYFLKQAPAFIIVPGFPRDVRAGLWLKSRGLG
jgi:hypothetical protein